MGHSTQLFVFCCFLFILFFRLFLQSRFELDSRWSSYLLSASHHYKHILPGMFSSISQQPVLMKGHLVCWFAFQVRCPLTAAESVNVAIEACGDAPTKLHFQHHAVFGVFTGHGLLTPIQVFHLDKIDIVWGKVATQGRHRLHPQPSFPPSFLQNSCTTASEPVTVISILCVLSSVLSDVQPPPSVGEHPNLSHHTKGGCSHSSTTTKVFNKKAVKPIRDTAQ